MGITGFEERRRAERAAQAPRVHDGSAPIGTPAQEAASVEQLTQHVADAKAARKAVNKLVKAAGTITPELQLQVDEAESNVTAAKAALQHAEEAEKLAGGKVETGVSLGAKVEAGTAGTDETTGATGDNTSPADRVDVVSTSTGAEVSESEPKAEPGAVVGPDGVEHVGEIPAEYAAPTMDNTRAEIDAFAGKLGIDTSGAPNKAAALALIDGK